MNLDGSPHQVSGRCKSMAPLPMIRTAFHPDIQQAQQDGRGGAGHRGGVPEGGEKIVLLLARSLLPNNQIFLERFARNQAEAFGGS